MFSASTLQGVGKRKSGKGWGKEKIEKLLLVWAVLEEREKDLVQTIDLYIQRVFVFRPADETTEGI